MDTRGIVEGIPASVSGVRFGSFSLNLQTGELRKHGVRVRLQGKPFQILRALLERPGHVVTREELRERLWSSDTVVDFESRLNTAMNRLRITLGDSAESPIYIETISRLGYRFVAPVDRAHEQAGEAAHPEGDGVSAIAANDSSPREIRKPALRYWISGLLLLLCAIVVIAGLRAYRSLERPVSFQQVTFQKGFSTSARFTRDGKNILYSAGWNGAASRLYFSGVTEPNARELGGTDAWLAGFPSAGEVGFFTLSGNRQKMLLETEAYNNGTPHVISERAKQADWSRDGRLAIVTADGSNYSIEYAGQTIYRSASRLDNLRVSPSGDRIAFVEHPVPMDDAGRVMVVDSFKQARVLSAGWGSVAGLAWHPSGREVWFTAAASGVERSLFAVTLAGHLRTVAQMPGGMELRDIDSSGRVLIDRSTQHMSMMLGSFEGGVQRDISWLDWSRAVAMSADGKSILFDESGSGGGADYVVFIEHAGSDTPKRIGEGRAMDLSSDGRWALAQDAHDETKLMLISADGATHQPVQGDGIEYRWAKFLPGARDILFSGAYPNQSPHLYEQRLPDGPVALVSKEPAPDSVVLSSDGRRAVAPEDDGHIALIDLTRHRKRIVPLARPVHPIAFSGNDEVLTSNVHARTIAFELLNLNSGRLKPYARIEMPDSTGIVENLPVYVSGDLRSYVYSRLQSLSSLFVVSGWK